MRQALRPTQAELFRFFRFALVGGAFAIAYAVSAALLVGLAGWPPYLTSIVLYALCIPLAFGVQMRFTFGLRRTHGTGFVLYAGTQLVCLAVVTLATTQFVTRDVLLDTFVYLVSAGLAAILSYVVSSRFAFKQPG